MMKATELMVGNIVEIDGKPQRIRSVTRRKVAYCRLNSPNQSYARIHDIAPIPITEELLVRIGLKRENVICSEKYFFKNIPNYTIVVKSHSNTIGRDWSVHIDNDDADSVADVDIQYLHQLQNLLNIMDIKLDFVV